LDEPDIFNVMESPDRSLQHPINPPR